MVVQTLLYQIKGFEHIDPSTLEIGLMTTYPFNSIQTFKELCHYALFPFIEIDNNEG